MTNSKFWLTTSEYPSNTSLSNVSQSMSNKTDRNERIENLKESELSTYIATLLISELPEKKRNIHECERILKESLDIIKGVTLDNSIERRK